MSAKVEEIRALASQIRVDVLNMVHRARASHVGSCFSMADMLAVLYGAILNVRADDPKWPSRDRLVVSKGHAAAALYAVLADRGFIRRSELDSYCTNGSLLTGHVSHHVPGVETSTGSLGHGLSIAVGHALAMRMDGLSARSFVILSDGECDEGAVWEAALFAGHHKLSNLVALVDYNKIQSFGRVVEVLDLEPFAKKWLDFGWSAVELDGHDHGALITALSAAPSDRPLVVICHTLKGKGVSFMENALEWHYKSPDPDQHARALTEIGAIS